MVVGLIHCRSRSQASFMMPREHRGRPVVKDTADRYREGLQICEIRHVTDQISEIRCKLRFERLDVESKYVVSDMTF